MPCSRFPARLYIIGLGHIADKNAGVPATVAMVLGFNVIMLALLEMPLLAFTFAPEWTPDAVNRFKAWFNSNSQA